MFFHNSTFEFIIKLTSLEKPSSKYFASKPLPVANFQ
jgi:hypothetical protein